MTSQLESILLSASFNEAMEHARTATSTPATTLDQPSWLSVADFAYARTTSDPAWFALCIFAHEQRSDVGKVEALIKRAWAIVAQGPDATDPFRDPERFFTGMRRFIDGDSSPAAIEAFQRAMDVIFTGQRATPEWESARLRFLRSRGLRELGQALQSLAKSGVAVPSDLTEWLVWGSLQEVEGRVIGGSDRPASDIG